MEYALKSKTIGELRKAVKQLKIKQPKGCKKVELIRLLRKYIKETGEYKHVLVDLLNLDVADYLNKYKKIFIKKKEKRNKIKKIFDSFDLKFDKDSNDFNPIKKKKIKIEANFEEFFKPDYEIVEVDQKYIKKFKTYRKSYKIIEIHKLRPEQYPNILKDLFRKAIGKIQGRVDIVTHNPQLSEPFHPEMMSTREAYETYLDVLTHKIEYKELNIKDCIFDFHVIELPSGGRHTAKKLLKEEDIVDKKSIIQIKNDDNICLARSIITALAVQNPELLCEKLDFRNLNKNDIVYIKKGRLLQKTLAVKLHEMCNIPLEVCNLEQVKQFEDFLDIQITIFCRENFNEKIYSGQYKSICIYIYKNKNHFDVITSVTGFLGKNNYCDYCKVSYKRKYQHKCPKKCSRCFVENIDNIGNCKGEEIKCNDCFRSFKGKKCFKNHTYENKKGFSVCELLWKCLKCNRNIDRIKRKPEDHKCGERMCENCRNWVDKDHKCYMKQRESKGGTCKENCVKNVEDKNNWCDKCKYSGYTEKYMFFDVETNQETGNHEVNLVVNHDFNGEENIFSNENEYCNWLFDTKHFDYTVLAHYGKGFDFQFLAKYCFKNKIKVFTIYQGNKLIYMQAKEYNIRFIDSINFTLIPLRNFPKTFGLNELAKGYFPHLFNVSKNQNYIGKYPAKYYYGYDSMTTEQRKSFNKWYETEKNEVFDFQKEFIKYCRSDVDILRRGCLELRRLFLEIANIDPFKYVTLAGVCMGIFRDKFLQKDTIAIDEDVIQKDQYSKKSIVWLDYLSQKHNINIQHALNGGEKKLKLCDKTYKVDGFCENTVYQFHGCYWHGCNNCFTRSSLNMHKQIEMDELYRRTNEIENKIKDQKYELIVIWECDFDNDKEIQKYMKKEWKRDFVEPLNPRNAFYGGRCEPTKLKYDMKSSEKGRYIDVCSLYPTVNYFDDYPIGHPKKIYNPEKYDKNWYGLIQCKVLPPRKLYHPVLPYKEEKLIFSLCKSCSKTFKCEHCKTDVEKKKCKKCYEMRNKECNHTDEERSFIGTWTTTEVELAIQKGYKIMNIYEVWHFERKTDTLFRDYVKMFLKIKLETDDKWSENFKTVEEYKKYVKEKLDINMGEIKKNPGMRFIAKICLNSLWGKFGQRKNMKKTEYVMELEDFYRIILNDAIKDLNMIFLNEDCVEMTYKKKDEYVEDNFNTNIYIAAFTTSSARIRLYKMLDKLGDKVMYYDTDSVVYIDNGTNKIKTGCMLGEWTDELGDNKYIKSWISGASKDYGYILNDDSVIGKVKGFKMSYESETKLDFDKRMKIITGETEHIDVEINQFQIQKDRNIKVNKMNKRYMFGFDKRRILEDFNTVPFGY